MAIGKTALIRELEELPDTRCVPEHTNALICRDALTDWGEVGFLAFIVSGDINVNPDVGDAALAGPTPTNADLVGAFLADGNFKGGTDGPGDTQLVIYGTVAADADLNGTGNVITERDMDTSNDKPGVAFIWNPNLLLNAPEDFEESLTDWREVAP